MQEKLDCADEFTKFEGGPIPRTRERLTTMMLLRRLGLGWAEWSPVLREADGECGSRPAHPQNTAEYLATLLNESNVQDPDPNFGCEPEQNGYGYELPPPSGESPSDLYRCSWCRTPSAVLKRCKTCGKARYVHGFFLYSHGAYYIAQVLRRGVPGAALEGA